VLRLQQAGEPDAAEALLKLVAGNAVSPVAKPKRPSGRARNTPWHAEASRLRAQGLDLKAIAAKLRRPQSLVRWALDENGERMRARQRVNASRSRRPAQCTRRDDEAVIRTKRDIRAVLPPQEVKRRRSEASLPAKSPQASYSACCETTNRSRRPEAKPRRRRGAGKGVRPATSASPRASLQLFNSHRDFSGALISAAPAVQSSSAAGAATPTAARY
jgi:hypothetical protein